LKNASLSRPLHGAAMILSGMAIIGLIDNFIRIIAQESGLWQFHLIRSAVVCAILFVLARWQGWTIRPNNWSSVILRSGFASGAMVLYFGAAAVLPVAQAGAGLFTAPIFVLIFSSLFFGAPIGVWRILAVAAGFAGVLLILRPDVDTLTWLAFLPVFAGALWGLAAVLTRQMCDGESTATLLFGFFAGLGLWGLAGVLLLAIFPAPAEWVAQARFFTIGWMAPTSSFVFWMTIQALGSLVAVGFLTRGYQSADASYITVFEFSFLIHAGFWGWIVWGDTLDAYAISGIAVIVASGVIIAFRTKDI
jgi:drug/metabolite transporter (DMT)-like permease